MKTALRSAMVILSLALIAYAGSVYWKTSHATAEGEMVGYVDLETVVKKYSKAAEAQKSLDAYQQQIDKELKEKIIKKYKTDDPSKMPAEAQPEIEKMISEAKSKIKKQFDQVQKQKWDPAQKNIKEAIKAVAKARGLRVVVDKAVVLAGGSDITKDVIARLNKK